VSVVVIRHWKHTIPCHDWETSHEISSLQVAQDNHRAIFQIISDIKWTQSEKAIILGLSSLAFTFAKVLYLEDFADTNVQCRYNAISTSATAAAASGGG
jgi:hypothetical protein